MKRKNPRTCKVVTVIPSSDKDDIILHFDRRADFLIHEFEVARSLLKDSYKTTSENILLSNGWVLNKLNVVLSLSIASLVISIVTLIVFLYV